MALTLVWAWSSASSAGPTNTAPVQYAGPLSTSLEVGATAAGSTVQNAEPGRAG